ncbi:hypothetical protein GJ496_003623 [Pomphorhynchus laevis]|nr:hypothetical protein GJ496_003623 [Pomphorhynchus laevis]
MRIFKLQKLVTFHNNIGSYTNRLLTTKLSAVGDGNTMGNNDLSKVAQMAGRTVRTSLKHTPFRFHSLATSLRYMESESYRKSYGDDPVWINYVRNFKGPIVPNSTRKSCVTKNVFVTGNPCPICRDEYLIVDEKNLKLIKQFISPYTHELYETSVTSVCQKQMLMLEIAIERARNAGTLTKPLPVRHYDNKYYYYDQMNKCIDRQALVTAVIENAQ